MSMKYIRSTLVFSVKQWYFLFDQYISAFYYVQTDLLKVKFGRVIFYHNFLVMKNKFDEGATYLHVEENLWCCIDEE